MIVQLQLGIVVIYMYPQHFALFKGGLQSLKWEWTGMVEWITNLAKNQDQCTVTNLVRGKGFSPSPFCSVYYTQSQLTKLILSCTRTWQL